MIDYIHSIPLPALGAGLSFLAFILSLGRYRRPILRFLGVRKRSHRRRARQAKRNLKTLAGIESPAQKLAYLRALDPFTFEEMILETFEQRGYRVKRNARYSGDGGIDGRVYIDGDLYLIQAKRYQSHISARHVDDFCMLVANHQCRGFFVHTGKTGRASRTIADDRPGVWIISGQRLLALLDPDRRL